MTKSNNEVLWWHSIPKDLKWRAGYFKIERLEGADASLCPANVDFWFCRISHAENCLGIGDLDGPNIYGRPMVPYRAEEVATANHPRKDPVKAGCGDRYLDRMAATPGFVVTPVEFEIW